MGDGCRGSGVLRAALGLLRGVRRAVGWADTGKADAGNPGRAGWWVLGVVRGVGRAQSDPVRGHAAGASVRRGTREPDHFQVRQATRRLRSRNVRGARAARTPQVCRARLLRRRDQRGDNLATHRGGVRAVGALLARRTELDPALRTSFAAQIAERYRAHLTDNGSAPMAQLLRLFETESDARARGLPSPGAKGAARERHAIIALNAGRWNDFSAALASAQRRGLRSMSPEEVSQLVSLYREVSTDLARLRTASDSEDSQAIFYVSRLLGAGHNFLYRQRALSVRDVWRFVSISVPREVRRSAPFILAAAFFLFVPMAITYGVLVRHPALAPELLPPGMIERVTEGAHRDSTGKHEYISTKDFERPVLASSIISNNVQITFGAFAAGITAGIVTLMMLVFNGVSIGAGFGLYANHGVFHQIRDFVIAHSVLELSAILHCGRRRLSPRLRDSPARRAHAARGLRDQWAPRDSAHLGIDADAARGGNDRGTDLSSYRHPIRCKGERGGGHRDPSRVLVLPRAGRRGGGAGRGVRLYRAASLELEVVIHHRAGEALRRDVEHRHARAAHAHDRLVARSQQFLGRHTRV